MDTLRFDIGKKYGKFKLLNATNGGPWHKRHETDQAFTNFADYKAANIPYSRNHDAGLEPMYGGPYSHDITRIFPNFDADETDPASYEFACTDEAILVCLEAGTKTFFRLGQSIEHQIKKYMTLPPKDFKKWAVICEHIIRHYTEGWADGFHFDMPYWEIWNEPDLDPDDAKNKRTWGGTKQQFFDLYEIAAKHLKQCFPHLKIGGPSLAWNEEWAEDFLREMQERKAPLDFFSWHIYCAKPERMVAKAERLKTMLTKYGFDTAESILNEWNYIKGWTDEYIYSVRAKLGEKGAAFTMAAFCAAQASSIDMLMYYETRPTKFNGVFDFYTAAPLKGYYPFKWYGMFYDLENEVRAVNDIADIYSLCGVDGEGKVLSVVDYYTDDDSAEDKTFAVDFGKSGKYEIYLVDRDHDGEWIETTEDPVLTLKPNAFVLIKEI